MAFANRLQRSCGSSGAPAGLAPPQHSPSFQKRRAHMAYGQIDPARLQDDALARWYLRSPADIEQGRQDVAAQRYDDFFGGRSALVQKPDQAGQSADTEGGAESGAESQATSFLWRRWAASPPDSQTNDQLSPVEREQPSDVPRIMRVAAPAWLCVGCHGTGISPAPPAFSKPPWATPWTPGPNLTPRKPAKPHPLQCAMQNMRDSRICSREPNSAWQDVCLPSAAEREAYCISHEGQVDWPPLERHDRR